MNTNIKFMEIQFDNGDTIFLSPEDIFEYHYYNVREKIQNKQLGQKELFEDGLYKQHLEESAQPAFIGDKIIHHIICDEFALEFSVEILEGLYQTMDGKEPTLTMLERLEQKDVSEVRIVYLDESETFVHVPWDRTCDYMNLFQKHVRRKDSFRLFFQDAMRMQV